MVTIRDVCTRAVVVATGDTTVAVAAQLMRRHRVGTLVVCDRERRPVPVGIVTDRDIVVEVVALDLRPDTVTVGDIMGGPLVTVRETGGILEALELMRDKAVRRLAVVGPCGDLTGIVSADELVRVLAGELGDVARVMTRGRVPCEPFPERRI